MPSWSCEITYWIEEVNYEQYMFVLKTDDSLEFFCGSDTGVNFLTKVGASVVSMKCEPVVWV